MEKNSIYTIAITLFVFIVLASLYNFYLKIKKLSSTQTQIQKHLMYQQNIIEKHDSILQNSSEQPVTLRRQEIANLPSLNEMEMEMEMENENVQQKPTERRSRPNPIESLLPMLSSVMGMMSQGGNNENIMMDQNEEEMDEEEDDDDDYEDDSEEEGSEISERKMEMVQEIANELKELDIKNENLVTEGRLDEEVSVENA